MKLTAEIAGEKHELNIRLSGARVVAEIDGRSYEIRARSPGSGVHLLIFDGHVYECQVRRRSGPRALFDVHVGSRDYSVALTDPKRLRGVAGSGAHSSDASAQIVAPMPGKVVRVLVEAGAQVKAGDGLLVVEAMKMQNEMKSPKDGTVVVLHAKTGATVNAGDVLAVVE